MADDAISKGDCESAKFARNCYMEALELYQMYQLDNNKLYDRIKAHLN